MKTQRTFSIVMTMVAVIAMASLWLVGTASAAAPGPAPIVIKAQDCCDTGQIVVDSAVAPQDGWLGLFKDSNGSLGSLVGYTPVHKGQNTQFTVDINSNKIGQAPTLWAGFLADFSGTGIFNMASVRLAPNSPLVGFATTAAVPAVAPATSQPAQPVAAPVVKAPTANQITIKAQDCCDAGQIVVDSAVALQDGWLGLFKNSNGSLGSLVGYTPVHKGQNTQFTVDINSNKIGQAPTLWAGFLVDFSGTGIFNMASVRLAPNSPLVGFATMAAK